MRIDMDVAAVVLLWYEMRSIKLLQSVALGIKAW